MTSFKSPKQRRKVMALLNKGVPKTLWHLTDKSNRKSIEKKGLIATPDEILFGFDNTKGVNLVTNPNSEVLRPKKKSDFFVRISTKGLKKKLQDMEGGWFRYKGSIPPKNLKFPK